MDLKKPDHLSPKELSLYQKGLEILDTVKRISDLIPAENKHLHTVKDQMLGDAMVLSVKVSSAAVGDFYDLKMEAAALIRKAARDLMVQNHSLEMFDFEDARYFRIVREQIEEYRLLFIEWVNTFDERNYTVDRWGLFNPPDIGPFDHDPDNDLPS